MQQSSQFNGSNQRETNGQGSSPGAASGLADEARDKARQVAGRAEELADGGKSKLADGADGLADALHHASDNLRSDDQAEVARYTQVVADKLGDFSQFLRGRDLPSMASDLKRFAQRQPALFLGGAFTAGLLAARFLKSSPTDAPADTSRGPAPAFALPREDDYAPTPASYLPGDDTDTEIDDTLDRRPASRAGAGNGVDGGGV